MAKRIGILTSSRADFGVYEPLLNALTQNNDIVFDIIAFGTHLSQVHGFTLNEILNQDYKVSYTIPSLLASDDEESVSTSFALTAQKFASFWAQYKNKWDLVLCLGDRYEMCAAVLAGVPMGIKFAHLYGGDRSMGAIDNVYRDTMTAASVMHFTSTEKCKQRVAMLTENSKHIKVIGILSLAKLKKLKLFSMETFKKDWNIDLKKPTILICFHTETINAEKNTEYVRVIGEVLAYFASDYQLVITMPNADTLGNLYRKEYLILRKKYPGKVFLVENFGNLAYYTCMKYAKLLIGNTSSGISEAPSFNTYFINVGDRQKGREFGENVINVPFKRKTLIEEINIALLKGEYKGENPYYKPGSIQTIIHEILNYEPL